MGIVQELLMRRTLNIALVLSSLFIKVMASPSKTVAETDAAMSQFGNVVSIYGLHLALPDDMMRYPAEFIPLP
jgi:hypothetical protein